MPNSPSAKKRVLQNAKRKALNRWRRLRVKNQIKSFLSAVQSRDVASAEAEFRKTAGLLDKIACTGTLHRNMTARKKSRLARRLNELKAASAGA